ncbi:MAG: O-antigen ligase family protein [Actinomycetota bacterium]|nr:O-antigen ligase family protein [Actinomycetota bacterium]
MVSSSERSWHRRAGPSNVAGRLAGQLAIVALALAAGLGIAVGSKLGLLIAGAALLFAAASVGLFQFEIPRYSFGYMAIELPALFILIASLGLRARTAEDLAANPLDFVGLLRLASTGLACMLGIIACISAKRIEGETTTNRPLRIYMMYAVVACTGVLASVSPALTGYRAFEVVAAIFVICGAYRTAGKEALMRLEALLYWWCVVLVGTVWLGVAAFPALTVQRLNSPIPYQIQGVYPGVTSNTLGELAVLLLFWSIGRVMAPAVERGPRRSVAIAIAVLGFVTLLGAQYRTGYAAVMLGIAILLFLRGRKVLATYGVVAAVVGTILGSKIAIQAAPVILRGQNSSQITNLNGRLNWWELAIPIWKKSPIIGGGLRTASRLLVLGASGFGQTSTVHSTWVEALVGTGVLGVAALAAFLMVSMWRAFVLAIRPHARIVPLLALMTLAVRSFTGDTFESGGLYCLITLIFVMGLRDNLFTRTWVPTPEEIDHVPEPVEAGSLVE